MEDLRIIACNPLPSIAGCIVEQDIKGKMIVTKKDDDTLHLASHVSLMSRPDPVHPSQ